MLSGALTSASDRWNLDNWVGRVRLFVAAWETSWSSPLFGAHPGGCTGFYGQDKIHMRDYVIASKDDESFAEYIRAHVFEVQNHADYIERFVPLDWRQPARAAGA